MHLYGERAFVHISSEPDDKEAASMTPLTKCVCCNWSVCSQRCQDSPGHNTECQATHDSGNSIGVVHFDQINVIYVCLAVMIALSLPGNIKEVTTVKQASNNENTLDVRLKEYEINTSEGLIPGVIVDREEKVVAKDLKANS